MKALQGFLQGDTLILTLSFLDVRSFLRFRCVAGSLSEASCEYSLLWKELVTRRWNIPPAKRERLLRSVGASSWKQAYEILHCRAKCPRSIYFDKHQIIFAKGEVSGVYGWLTIGHTADSRLSAGHTIELRLCLQNALHDCVEVDSRSIRVLLKTQSGCGLLGLPISKVSLIAFNGVSTSSSATKGTPKASVQLRNSEHAVFALRACCPYDVSNEVDVLTRAEEIRLQVLSTDTRSCAPPLVMQRSLSLAFHDELSVWNHFTELPGGVVLLNTDSAAIEVF